MYKYLYRIYFISLLIVPVILISLPADFFDYGDSICLSVFLFDSECFACGITRSLQHLIHLDFHIAYSYNKLSFIVFPLLMVSYIKEVIRVYNYTNYKTNN